MAVHTHTHTQFSGIMWLTEPNNDNEDKSEAEDVRGEISVMTVVVLMAAHKTQAKKQFNFVILTFTERFEANGLV